MERISVRQYGNINDSKGTIDISRYKSVIAVDHSPARSEKFAFIPTTRVIDVLQDHGWIPNKISEKRSTKLSTAGYGTHLVRFRQVSQIANLPTKVGDLLPEIVLKNAHDGTAAFNLMAGIFRLVCSNGMIVADSLFSTHKIRHIGYQDQNVIDAVYDMVSSTPRIMGRIADFKQIELDGPEQVILAQSALAIKYDAEDLPKYSPSLLARPTRREDTIIDIRPAPGTVSRNTLWNTYNVIQEKLIERGGRFQFSANHRTRKARGVSSVTENVRLNQALWTLTERMYELKSGGNRAVTIAAQ